MHKIKYLFDTFYFILTSQSSEKEIDRNKKITCKNSLYLFCIDF